MTTLSGKNTSGSTELLPESLLVTNDNLIKFPAPLSSLEETALKLVYFYKQKYCKTKKQRHNFLGLFGLLQRLGSIKTPYCGYKSNRVYG